MQDKLNSVTEMSAGLIARPDASEKMQIIGRYRAECYDADGKLKWVDEFDNIVTTEGKNDMLDQYLRTSGTYTGATIYMGLKGTGTAAAGDTLSSHAGWSELNISSSSGARQATTFDAASAGAKSTPTATPVSWSITDSGTVHGCFIAIGATYTNANTTGKLFSAGDFSGGSRAVISGDTLKVSYSVSI